MYIHVRARVHMGHVCERGRVRVLESFIVKSMLTLMEQTLGRRQEFFQGRALGGSRGGLPSHFFKFQGGGAQPRFLVASMAKMKEFRGQGWPCPPCLCLPTPLQRPRPVAHD